MTGAPPSPHGRETSQSRAHVCVTCGCAIEQRGAEVGPPGGVPLAGSMAAETRYTATSGVSELPVVPPGRSRYSIAAQGLTLPRLWVQAIHRGELVDIGMQPGLALDWHRIYVVWCAHRGTVGLPAPHLIRALKAFGLATTRRERFIECDVVTGPASVLFFDTEIAPPDLDRRAWLGEQIAITRRHADAYSRSM